MVPITSTKPKVFISAAEPSADAHCANLITALKTKGYNINFVGVGGERMAEAGCELLGNPVAEAAMIYKAFGRIGFFFKLIRRISAYFKKNKVDLIIVCD